MLYLILGLVLFLGAHSVRIVADDWRTAMLRQVGEMAYKGGYAAASLVGFVLLVWGFGQARQDMTILWSPPVAMRHVAALVTLLAFVLTTAAYVPGNAIKARLHHPMVLGVKAWAFAHLLANGRVVHVVLFGAFLLWSVACFVSCQRRDREQGTQYAAGRLVPTLLTVVIGTVAWLAFAFVLHGMLIGVRPFG
jgi:uncharacterized membrane protein